MLKFTRSIKERFPCFSSYCMALFKNANGLQQAPEQRWKCPNSCSKGYRDELSWCKHLKAIPSLDLTKGGCHFPPLKIVLGNKWSFVERGGYRRWLFLWHNFTAGWFTSWKLSPKYLNWVFVFFNSLCTAEGSDTHKSSYCASSREMAN